MSEMVEKATDTGSLTEDQPITEVEAPAEKRFRWGNAAIWLVVIAVLAALGWGLINVNAPRPEVGGPAPPFEMQFFDDYRWEQRPTALLDDMNGKVVVMNFWASWCVECRLEADLLEQASREYGDEVVFLGIAYIDAEPNSLAYLEEYDVTYPNAPDLRSAISAKYKITGVPETFFIGKDGEVARVHIGPVSSEVLYGQIDQLLAQ